MYWQHTARGTFISYWHGFWKGLAMLPESKYFRKRKILRFQSIQKFWNRIKTRKVRADSNISQLWPIFELEFQSPKNFWMWNPLILENVLLNYLDRLFACGFFSRQGFLLKFLLVLVFFLYATCTFNKKINTTNMSILQGIWFWEHFK